MGRNLKPCGTEAAYRRHLRAYEEPCALCAAVHREEQLERDRTGLPPLVVLGPPPADVAPVDPLEQARWALRQCVAAIEAQRPGLAGLLREHSRLVALVVELEGAPAVDAPMTPDEPFFPDDRRSFDAAAI